MEQNQETKKMIMRQVALKAATHLAGKRPEMGLEEIKAAAEDLDEWLNKPFYAKKEKVGFCSCGKPVTQRVHDFAMERFKKVLCMTCQKKEQQGGQY